MKYGPILENIILEKGKLVEKAKKKIPMLEINSLISDLDLPIEFKSIFTSQNVALIAEIKRSSASAGQIFPDLNLQDLVPTYINNGASAISILTEKTRFSGTISDLTEVSSIASKIKKTPTLQKDFVIDEYQVYESRLRGASAILIIASILSKDVFKSIINKCREVSITPLVEVFTERELELALENNAEVIGINNRNLNNLETSLEVFENLAPKVPSEKILIAESGIRHTEDVIRMSKSGADAVLVGESILKNKDIPLHIKELSNIKKCK